jgi:glycosyltransferase involved in cell wall biosynthesis
MNSFRISIVIPLYNKAGFVERALRSVLAQSGEGVEILVVDDGSMDGGDEVVRRIVDPRIRLIHQENRGVSAARNRGIAEAGADWIAFLDADDEWLPGFLETVVGLRSQFRNCDVFATAYMCCLPDGRKRAPIFRGLPRGKSAFVLEDYFAVASRSDPPIHSSAVAINKHALEAIHGFPEGVSSGEDLLTWARLLNRYQCAYSPTAQALFYCEGETWGPPTRRPDVPDVVGRELALLVESAPTRMRKSVQRYVALWHKMRASVYLRSGNRQRAFLEICGALRYSFCTPKLYAYLALCLVPRSVVQPVIECRNHLRDNEGGG